MLSGLLRRHAPRPGQNSLLATALLRGEPSTAVAARCLCARARKKPWQKDAAPKGPREGEQALKLKELRLICDTGEQLGVVKPADALKLADERGLRLVEVAAASKPTVWKLMTAEQAVARQPPPPPEFVPPPTKKLKQKKTKKGKDRIVDGMRVKELRVTDKSEEHDVATRLKMAREFLAKGRIVKIVVLNTGRVDREGSGRMRAELVVERFEADLADAAAASDRIGFGAAREEAPAAGAPAKNLLGVCGVTLTPTGRDAEAEPS